jgi:flagellar assembly protein FliH
MSSSPLIPREKLSAYQRWELNSFDIPGDYHPPTRMPEAANDDAAKIESIRRIAYDAGRADGLRDGALGAADEVQRLRGLFATLTRQDRELTQHLADDLLGLALELARQMVRRSLTAHPEIIIPLLNDALAQLSNATAQLRIALHPADAALVRTHLAEQIKTGHWQLIEDASLLRGGGVLQTATSHVDATLGTRWQHLATRLGLEDQWID